MRLFCCYPLWPAAAAAVLGMVGAVLILVLAAEKGLDAAADCRRPPRTRPFVPQSRRPPPVGDLLQSLLGPFLPERAAT